MPFPWEYDPETNSGQGPVTRSDRYRIAFKYLFAVAGLVIIAASSSGNFGEGIKLGLGIGLTGAGVVDLIWMTRGDIDHTFIQSRSAARWCAAIVACTGVSLVVWSIA